METVLTSKIVDRQLPDFVRSEHPKFVTFLKKYYEWLEQNNQVNYEIERLKESIDIDDADAYYLNLLKRDLLPYFPENIVADKKLFLKLVNQFYKASGTPDSIKFLFKALYNDNIDIYYPKEDVLRASDGKWTLPLALRIDTTDSNIFNIAKTLLTGTTSKATAVVEKVIQSVDRQLGIKYIEVYISSVQRLFATGETVTATYIDETTNLPVTVSGRLVGALSEIKIDPNNRGLFYTGYDPEVSSYPGDPVTIIGGLNPTATNPVGALAYVGNTTKGAVTDVITVKGGFGFRNTFSDGANTILLDFAGGFENAPIGTEADARIILYDDANVRTINISNMKISTLNAAYANINVANAITIANISGANYQSFNVYSIALVDLIGGGGGYRNKPSLETYSFFNEDEDDIILAETVEIRKDFDYITKPTGSFVDVERGDLVRLYKKNPLFESVLRVKTVIGDKMYFDTAFTNDISAVSVFLLQRNNLYNLGSIGRINIVNPGSGYSNGNVIIFTGGSGYGANAYINVNSSGSIVSVTINNHSSNAYLLGGEGYRKDALPTLNVLSTGTGAVLEVSEILGDGEQYDLLTSKIGSISSIRIVSYGYDYVEAPIVSLRNMDLTVANVTSGRLFVSNTIVYQGTSNSNFTFRATVDSYNAITNKLRLFNYIGLPSTSSKLKYDSPDTIEFVTADVLSNTVYGDGRAKANATFENGLIRYPGIYVNNDGHLSSDKYLQDGEKYHNFSYEIKTGIDYATFKKPLNEIAHPVGTKTFTSRIVDIKDNLLPRDNVQYITVNNLSDTFNVVFNSNSVISTNTSANLLSQVNVGDTIILKDVYRGVTNTVNVVSGSNTVYGQNTNFIRDIQDGEMIYLGTGNTETVLSVSNANYLITQNTIGVTQNNVTINVFFDEVKTVNFVNANTIKVDTNFSCISDTFVSAIIQKVE